MDERSQGFGRVDLNVATNLRRLRELRDLSQDDLAQRMTDRGFGFSQATIWKIEQGKRPLKVSELVAISDALELRGWTVLLEDPDFADPQLSLRVAHRRAFHAYHALKAATAAFLEAQVAITLDAARAKEAGAEGYEHWTSWLATPAERAVLEARVEFDKNETYHDDVDDLVDQLVQGIRDRGYEPLMDPDSVISSP